MADEDSPGETKPVIDVAQSVILSKVLILSDEQFETNVPVGLVNGLFTLVKVLLWSVSGAGPPATQFQVRLPPATCKSFAIDSRRRGLDFGATRRRHHCLNSNPTKNVIASESTKKDLTPRSSA